MGFLDSIEKGLKNFFDAFEETNAKEQEKYDRMQKGSSYKTQAQQKREHYEKLESLSDSKLLYYWGNESADDTDKEIIEGILRRRGYDRNGDHFDKK